jgi:hypothetical protein
MIDILWNIPSQPAMYQLVLFILLLLLVEAAVRIRQLRWGLAAIVYITIGLWYFIDPIYRPEVYGWLSDSDWSTVYTQVLIFLATFRLAVQGVAPKTPSRILRAFDPRELDRGSFVRTVMLLWCILFAIGMYRADFRFVDALFPMGARWQGAQMWSRARLGGFTDFLSSLGMYGYLMTCAVFGLIAVGTRRPSLRFGMIFMMCLTWPMFALGGSRSLLLTVAMPSVLGALILNRWTRLQQVLFLTACFLVINTIMLVSIAYRNEGVSSFFDEESYSTALDDVQHDGLNMPEELAYINLYQSNRQLSPELGYEYFSQAVNFVPRFIWPAKPFPGEKFAALRVGYLDGAVAATVSNGLIGQGVQNFGKWLGPMAPAVILTALISCMCRLLRSGIPFLRSAVVIFLMALIPNLGRDLTLLNLWPAIFAVVGVFAFEKLVGSPSRSARRSLNEIPRPLPR